MQHQQKRVFKCQVLQSLPHAHIAMHLMERVCYDVNAMMSRNSLMVGSLEEFYPSPERPYLRGLNREKGHRIFLRLRKHENGLEFMDYAMILNTFVHELTHNFITEHSQHFGNCIWFYGQR